MHNERASYLGFKETFAALFVLNCWLREFPLSAIASRVELRCQSNTTVAIVLQNLPLFFSPSYHSLGSGIPTFGMADPRTAENREW